MLIFPFAKAIQWDYAQFSVDFDKNSSNFSIFEIEIHFTPHSFTPTLLS